jgi:SAM-dependent methyltransferase
MEEIRQYHNLVKRQLIQSATQSGSSVLDVGCGFGGDLQKWTHAGVRTLDMCDPSAEALVEARSRASKMKIVPNFFHGDILVCPTNKKYDIICYNFSLHYIFESYRLFKNSIRAIKDRLRTGGKLIGVIPDSESILMKTPFSDPLGNYMLRKDDTGYGNFGEKLFVNLADTPFYADGPKSEPIAYKDLLITELWEQGIELQEWKPLTGNPLSKMYSQFIFVRT